MEGEYGVHTKCPRPLGNVTGPIYSKKTDTGTSLVIQWLRICLPMRGTHFLVQEDYTGCGAAKPIIMGKASDAAFRFGKVTYF